jgi:restriction system protein
MAVPDFQSMMLPLLQFHADGKPHSTAESYNFIVNKFGLTEQDQSEKLPSGGQTKLRNRVTWAQIHLKGAEVLQSVSRGIYAITERGRQLLAASHEMINCKLLRQFPEYIQFTSPRGKETIVEPPTGKTPQEALEEAYAQLRDALVNDLRDRMQHCSPAFFERMVVDVLVGMGYGGSRADAGEAVGRSGDGGIDGIIKEDRLGLDVIYVQAKRWSDAVSRPEIQKFAGALVGQRANKGIFITSSRFTADARAYAASIGMKIVLIDGEELASHMIEHGIAVTAEQTYIVKKLDSDYFSEE